MVEQSYVKQFCCLTKLCCHIYIGATRLRLARWVVVGYDYAGGKQLNCALENEFAIDNGRLYSTLADFHLVDYA